MNLTQIIISAALSLVAAVVAAYITHRFRNKEYKRDFIMERGYVTHERLLDNLRQFFNQPEIAYDMYHYKERNVEKLKELGEISKISFASYKEGQYSKWNNVEVYDRYIKTFTEQFRDDIYSLSKLSTPHVRSVAKKIIDTYDAYSRDAVNMLDEGLQDAWDLKSDKFHEGGQAYMDRIFEAYWGRCWLEILPDLERLKAGVEEFVALEKPRNLWLSGLRG